MAKMIKASDPRPIDHIKRIFLMDLDHTTGETSLTFACNHGLEIVSYNRLKELHRLIGKTLQESEESYEKFREAYAKQDVSE